MKTHGSVWKRTLTYILVGEAIAIPAWCALVLPPSRMSSCDAVMVTECETPPPAALRSTCEMPLSTPPVALRVTTPSGVSYEDLVVGDGPELTPEARVRVNYRRFSACTHAYGHSPLEQISVDGRSFELSARGSYVGSSGVPTSELRPGFAGLREGGHRRIFVTNTGDPSQIREVYDVEAQLIP